MDLANLLIRIDSREAVAGTKAVDELGKSAERTEEKVKGLGNETETTGKKQRATSALWDRAKFALTGLAASAGAYLTVSRGIAEVQERQRQQRSFEFLLGSARAAREEIGALKELANESGLAGGFVVALGQDLAAAKIRGEEAQRLLQSLIDLAAARGKSPQFIEGAIQAFIRLESRGKASVQELISLARLGIPVWESIAAKIGTDVPTAMKRAESGALDFDQAMDAILANLEAMKGAAAAGRDDLTGAMFDLKEGATTAAGDISEAFDEAFDLRGKLRATSEGLKGFGASAGQVIRILGNARREGEEFSTTAEVIAGALRAATYAAILLGGALAISKLMAWVGTMKAATLATSGFAIVAGTSTAAISTLTAVTQGLRLVLASINPFAALAVGIGVATAAMIGYSRSVRDAREAQREQREGIPALKEALESMTSLRGREGTALSIQDKDQLRASLQEQRNILFDELDRLRKFSDEFLSKEQTRLLEGVLGGDLPETILNKRRELFEMVRVGGREPLNLIVPAGFEDYQDAVTKTEDALSTLSAALKEMDDRLTEIGDTSDVTASKQNSLLTLWSKMKAESLGLARGVLAQVGALKPLREQLALAEAEQRGGPLAADILSARTKAFEDALARGSSLDGAKFAADEAEKIVRRLAKIAREQDVAKASAERFLSFFTSDFAQGLARAGKALQEGNFDKGMRSIFQAFLGPEAAKTHRAVKEMAAALEQEIMLLGLEERERSSTTAVIQAMNLARQEGTTITTAEVKSIQDLALALFDLNEAKRKEQEAKQKADAGAVEVQNVLTALRQEIAGYEAVGQTLGMTAREREVYTQVLAAELEVQKAKVFATKEEAEELDRLLAQLPERIQKAQADTRILQLSEDLATGLSDVFGELLVNLGDVKGAVESILLSIQQSLLRNLVTGPLQEQLSAFFQSLFSAAGVAASGFGGGGAAAGTPGGAPVIGSYFGNVFSRGRVTPHNKGGVIDSLTYFPMAGGRIGSMGENGRTEGILPLDRNNAGELGVKVVGAAQAPSAPTNVITNNWHVRVEAGEASGRTQKQMQRRAERYSFLGTRG